MGSRRHAGRTMNAPSLRERLARDLRRNPKKAVLLVLLAGVAIWFWAPLCVGLFRSDTEGEMLADAVTPTAAVPPAPAGPVPSNNLAPSAAAQTWQEVVRWMEQDPRRKVEEETVERDPFASPAKSSPPPGEGQSKAVAKLPANPDQLGIKLTGTLVGPQQRLALINGRAYAEGQTVKASADATYVVRKVEGKQAVLERDGKPFVVKAIKPREQESLISRAQE